jgi:integrase
MRRSAGQRSHGIVAIARARVRITKQVVNALSATGVDQFIWDSEVIGFGVRMSAKGLVTYVYQYFIDGRTRRYKIGIHGSPWTPELARKEAVRLAGQTVEGADPQRAKVEERKALIVNELCDLYLTEGLLTRKEGSISSARGDIENHIKPLLGRHKVATLERADLEGMMRDIATGKTAKTAKLGPRRLARVRGGRGAASSALAVLSAAVARKIRPDNPALGIRKFPSKKIERFLSPAELARLGEALSAASALGVESAYAIAALRLLILTGCRKNEILTLKRSHVDAYHRCLRLPDSKTGSKVVHLGAPAMKIIASIKEVAGNPYLLPGRKDGTHVTDLQAAWERIRKTAGLEDVRIHDLRHSFASMGAASGDSLMVIGALLGHRSAKTTERYAHLADHPVKAAADRISHEIARHLEEAVAAEADSVVTGAGDDPFALWQPNRDEPTERAIAPDPVLGAVIRTEWLDTRAAAVRLGLTVGTLQTYRWMGTGPAFRKIGRRVVYAAQALDRWAAVQRQSLGASAAAA